MTFAQRRNRLTTHLSERIPAIRRRMTNVKGKGKVKGVPVETYKKYAGIGHIAAFVEVSTR